MRGLLLAALFAAAAIGQCSGINSSASSSSTSTTSAAKIGPTVSAATAADAAWPQCQGCNLWLATTPNHAVPTLLLPTEPPPESLIVLASDVVDERRLPFMLPMSPPPHGSGPAAGSNTSVCRHRLHVFDPHTQSWRGSFLDSAGSNFSIPASMLAFGQLGHLLLLHMPPNNLIDRLLRLSVVCEPSVAVKKGIAACLVLQLTADSAHAAAPAVCRPPSTTATPARQGTATLLFAADFVTTFGVGPDAAEAVQRFQDAILDALFNNSNAVSVPRTDILSLSTRPGSIAVYFVCNTQAACMAVVEHVDDHGGLCVSFTPNNSATEQLLLCGQALASTATSGASGVGSLTPSTAVLVFGLGGGLCLVVVAIVFLCYMPRRRRKQAAELANLARELGLRPVVEVRQEDLERDNPPRPKKRVRIGGVTVISWKSDSDAGSEAGTGEPAQPPPTQNYVSMRYRPKTVPPLTTLNRHNLSPAAVAGAVVSTYLSPLYDADDDVAELPPPPPPPPPPPSSFQLQQQQPRHNSMSNIMQTLVSQLRDEEADNSRGATTSAPQQRVSAKTNLPPPLQYHTAMQGRVAYHTAARGSLVYERSNSNFAGYTLALADHDEVDSSTTDDDTGYCRATAGKSSDGGSQPGLSRGASATGSGAGTYDLAEADSKATSRGGSTSSAMSDTSSTPTYVRAQPPPSMGSSNSKQSRTYDYVGDDNGAGSGDYDLACHLGLKPASSDGMPPPLELSAARTSDVDGVLYEIGASSQTSDGDNSLYAAVMSSDGSYAFGSKAATLVSNSTATSGPLCSSYAELGGRVHSVKHLAPEAQSIISMSSLFETASRLGEAGGQGIQRQTSLPSSVSTPSQGETGEYDNVED